MNLAFKTAVAEVIDRLGVVSLLHRGGYSKSVVLALHRVLPREESESAYNPYVAVSVEALRELFAFLGSGYDVVSIADFVNTLGTSRLRRERIATITFDDGWLDNFIHAFPLLQEFKFPATIFLPTGLIGTTLKLPEERAALLWEFAGRTGRTDDLRRELLEQLQIRAATGAEMRNELKRIAFRRKLAFLDEQEQSLGISQGPRSFMNWDEVRTMHRAGITFGSHTKDHVVLPAEPDEVVRQEFLDSSADIEREIGAVPEFFAYPNGRFDDRVVKLCEEGGFRAAFITRNAFVAEEDHRMKIPRVAIDDSVLVGPGGIFNRARTRVYFARAASSLALLEA